MATTKTFSVPDGWNHKGRFIKLPSKELQKILEKEWDEKGSE